MDRYISVLSELFSKLCSGEVVVQSEPGTKFERKVAKLIEHDMWLVLRQEKASYPFPLQTFQVFSSMEEARKIGSEKAVLEIWLCEAAPLMPEDKDGYALTIKFNPDKKLQELHWPCREIPAVITVMVAFHQLVVR